MADFPAFWNARFANRTKHGFVRFYGRKAFRAKETFGIGNDFPAVGANRGEQGVEKDFFDVAQKAVHCV
jgi:hypothetical protein